jgi:IclR family KDG regulon transcriptional repressor
MAVDFKRVPAVDKCFAVLELLAEQKEPLGISQIAASLDLSKSTVFNLVHTLTDLGVLDNGDGKFRLGAKFYLLGKAAENSSDLIRIGHPFLEEISRKTGLTTFLGMRTGPVAVILDKVDSAVDLKVSTDVGVKMPLLAGAHGRALMSQLSDEEIDQVLAQSELKRLTPHSCTDQEEYKALVRQTREDGLAIDREEYIEGIRALAVPLDVKRPDLQLAVWAVGLTSQFRDEILDEWVRILLDATTRMKNHFFT